MNHMAPGQHPARQQRGTVDMAADQKQDLLFLTQRIPYPPDKGEKIRPFNMLKHLSRSWRVHLGCLIDDPADLAHRAVLAPYIADGYFGQINPKIRRISCLGGLLTGAPLSYAFFTHAGLKRWTRQVLTSVRPQAAMICSSNMAQYLIDNGPRPACVAADYADVDSEKWRAYAENARFPMRAVYAREHLKVLGQEEAIGEHVDAVSFVSQAEATLFKDIFPHLAGKAHGISSGVDSDYFSPEHSFEAPFDASVPTFTFCGTMDYAPNVEAVTWFATEILPLIRRREPRAAFYIVGSRPSPAVLALDRVDGVSVTGRVADVRPYVAHATASVAPMKVARGIQNKVLEAMAMAKTVIVSPEGLEGISANPGRDVQVAESAQGFADAALQVSVDKDDSMGKAARRLVVERYSWDAHLKEFDALLRPGLNTA